MGRLRSRKLTSDSSLREGRDEDAEDKKVPSHCCYGSAEAKKVPYRCCDGGAEAKKVPYRCCDCWGNIRIVSCSR